MSLVQLGIAVLWAVSSGFGFDPGFGLSASLEGRYFELSASATTEQKYHADGYTWGGEALFLLPIRDIRFIAGASVYGYDSAWIKQTTAAVVGIEYRSDDLRVRLQHQIENEYDTSLTSVSLEYALSPKWWYGASVGSSNGRMVGDLRLTFRP